MKILTVVENSYEENTYIVIDEKEVVVIDPGAPFEKIRSAVNEQQPTVTGVLLTHGHGDHILALNNFKKEIIYAHEDEKTVLENPQKNLAAMMGGDLSITGINFFKGDKYILKLNVQSLIFKGIEIYHTPGHTPGSCIIKIGDNIFSGDTLFEDTVGRTDFPGGNAKKLKQSIKIFGTFDRGCMVYPGHGTPFTLEQAYKVNFYLNR